MFEITATDLLGRNGIIHTKKGKIRTPCFVPVVHPESTKNLLSVNEFQTKYAVDFIITSSYILKNRYADAKIDLHKQTGFLGPIMTDSGAYQSLVYGEIEFTPEGVIAYQESIGSDFGVPLDIPIAINDSYEVAKTKVEETILRCKKVPATIAKTDTIWVGPIQGGRYLDLLAESSRVVSDVDSFGMFALGSVVELMSDYQYDTLVDMILTVKQHLDPGRPLHLFGAGHPSMFPLIVAAGCDSFDSAAYALYAHEFRYMTTTQTFLLEVLDDFPCSCPMCLKYTPKELLKCSKSEILSALASHNLFVCQTEIKNIRRAISMGTLWELLESRSLAHPNLKKGFDRLKKSSHLLINNTPTIKKKGIFVVSDDSLSRPEILSHKQRIATIASPSSKKLIVISLLHANSEEVYGLFKSVKGYLKRHAAIAKDYNFWVLDPIFGLYPLEISEVFPLAQYVAIDNLSRENIHSIVRSSLTKLVDFQLDNLFLIGNLIDINEVEKEDIILGKTNLDIKSFGFTIDDSSLSKILFILDQVLGK
ncbi:MAG: tRNA guanosine(15) transglycosylase TgtA [Candidatus Heimdallarchaeota archaeon]